MLAARQVLADARRAADWLENDEIDEQVFRILWAGTLALVRAVGHVLHRVDAAENPILRDIVRKAYRSWKQDRERHAIFEGFIELERNNILKEYRAGYQIGEIGVVLDPYDGGDRCIAVLPPSIYRPLAEGPFEGDDARDVLAVALQWWQGQLDEIESQLPSATQK